ncbi:MAG: TetR/AcrR family transcriptional regulator [Acidimicrobiia bacterium]|nr:TetR/AcrR family transcriptional regulator [Acidimicrobiia bacterium]
MTERIDATVNEISTPERIKTEALRLFLEEGYRGAAVRDIAERLGFTVPALYYHFKNKDAILEAIVEPFADAGEALLARLATAAQVSSPCELEVAAIEGYYDVIAGHLDVFRFVSTDRAVRSNPVAGHRLADQATRFLDLLAGADADHDRRLRAAAAVGAVRRPLRMPGTDLEADRAAIVAAALAALRSMVSAVA